MGMEIYYSYEFGNPMLAWSKKKEGRKNEHCTYNFNGK